MIRVPHVLPGDSIAHARNLVRSFRVRVLPIVSDEKTLRLLGIVARYNLLLVTSTKSEALVKDVMEEPRIVFRDTTEMSEAARLMLETDTPYAPVVDEHNSLLGVFGYESVVRYLLEVKHSVLEEPIEKYMTSTGIIYVHKTTPVYKVWQLMRTHNIPALPVVDDKERIIGVIAEYDLLIHGYTRPDLEADTPRRGPRVQEVMSTPPVTLYPSDKLYRAASIMIERDIGRVYIVEDTGRLVGVIDRGDIVSAWLGRKPG